MQPSDETLMAYVDDELAPTERAAIDASVADDPAIAARVATFRAQRERLARAFAPVLDEPVPERLIAVARQRPSTTEPIDLAAARERRQRIAPPRRWRQ